MRSNFKYTTPVMIASGTESTEFGGTSNAATKHTFQAILDTATAGIVTIGVKVDKDNILSTFQTIGTIDLAAPVPLFWQGCIEAVQFKTDIAVNGNVYVTSKSTR